MKKRFRDGHFEHLAKRCESRDEAFSSFEEFEEWFYRFHSHVLVTEWVWRRNSEEPYVMINVVGVFDNLNLMSLRIIGLINSVSEGKSISIGSEYTDGELCISMPNGRRIQCEFIPFNRVDECNMHEGWKFEIPPFNEEEQPPLPVKIPAEATTDEVANEPYEVISLNASMKEKYLSDCDKYLEYLSEVRDDTPMTFEEKFGYYEVTTASGPELRRKIKQPKALIPSPPEFVLMGGTALRLIDSNEYFRDAGQWSVGFEQRGTEFYSVSKGYPNLNGKLLTPCTEDEYKEDNKGYIA